ncbi:hypothetical protein PAPYR_8193 [Paratrimastix pyriformis]|uniref:Protein kinase domain-containing protein n=1 Tax=Paratrimastix pyriformis TaxID=342808 RepID=A0ABQ8UB73_9EUKA|nr:hypothetical protein PAPYR_8193 [Paratrimastix pyriformis]
MGQGASFPFVVSPKSETPNGLYILSQAVNVENNQKVSIFDFKKASHTPAELELVKNNAARLKSLRNSAILKFISFAETPTSFYIITEPVLPLGAVIAEMTRAEVTLGLLHIVRGLAFLHDHCRMVHGDLGLHALFVTLRPTNEWVLGNLNMCRPMDAPPATVTPAAVTQGLEALRALGAPAAHGADMIALVRTAKELLMRAAPTCDKGCDGGVKVGDTATIISPPLVPGPTGALCSQAARPEEDVTADPLALTVPLAGSRRAAAWLVAPLGPPRVRPAYYAAKAAATSPPARRPTMEQPAWEREQAALARLFAKELTAGRDPTGPIWQPATSLLPCPTTSATTPTNTNTIWVPPSAAALLLLAPPARHYTAMAAAGGRAGVKNVAVVRAGTDGGEEEVVCHVAMMLERAPVLPEEAKGPTARLPAKAELLQL